MKKQRFSKIQHFLLASILLFGIISCDNFNRKPAEAPLADTDLVGVVDASFATLLVSDVEMIAAFAGENYDKPTFYVESPNSDLSNGGGKTTVHFNPDPKLVFVNFNRTLCKDGHMRDGAVVLNFSNSEPFARYYRDYGFLGEITLSAYKVDGWLINTIPNGAPCKVYNLLPGANYHSSSTKLSWLIEGSFEFIHPTDPSKNMTWSGKLVKTLANSTDQQVFHSSKQKAINWSLGRVDYTGEAQGLTAASIPFSFKINERRPLSRDFTCFPDKIGGIASPGTTIWNNESHPFIGGIAELQSGDLYPRQIYYGIDLPADQPQPCDNTGVVLIKGNSYKVNFNN